MMPRLLLLASAVLTCLWMGPLGAAELKVLPIQTSLTGPHGRQRLLVVDEQDGKVIADRTAAAKLTSSNPTVAAIDTGGTVTATGDGEAIITATFEGRQTTAQVKVIAT